MSGKPMDQIRFQQILDAYGANDAAWPAPERASALAFCAANALAQSARAEAQALDEAMTPPAEDRDVALEARILNGFRRQGGAKPGRWLGAGAIAATALLGVTVAWIALRPAAHVDLKDEAAWDAIGEDLEYVAAAAVPTRN